MREWTLFGECVGICTKFHCKVYFNWELSLIASYCTCTSIILSTTDFTILACSFLRYYHLLSFSLPSASLNPVYKLHIFYYHVITYSILYLYWLIYFYFFIQHNNELNELMKDMEGWRAALLRLNSVIDWDRPYHPLVLLAPITFIFLWVAVHFIHLY